MRKWASNSRELNELIKKEETTLLSGKPAAEPTKSVETENIDKSEDCFKFDLSAFSKQTLSGTLTK